MDNVCSDFALMPILLFVKNTLTIIQIIVPIILIVMASIRLAQVVRNPEDKTSKKKIINTFLAAIIIFFIPMFINLIFNILGNNTTFSECWNKANFSTATDYIEIEQKKRNKIYTNPDEYEKGVPNSQGICLSKTKTTKILFVGNSKTYVNDIPNKFANIASNAGYKVSVSSVTEGGQTLQNLANKYSSKITSSAYDCIILQEQTDAYESAGSTYSNGIKKVTNMVRSKNNKAKVYVRALWILDSSSSSARNKSYSATEKYAKENNAGVIYDGKAFDNSRSKYPDINLYNDDRHQSKNGAYLSALVIYKTLSNDNPTKITYYAGINNNTAKKLQSIAAN